MPLFAIPGSERLAASAMKGLAVAGAFLVGYLLGGLAAWALDRWALGNRSPRGVKRAIRVVAGLAAAILVAWLVFGNGVGGGWFGGRGESAGAGTANPEPSKEHAKEPERKPQQKIGPKDSTDYEVLTVTFLGGDDVQGNRFYRLDGSEPLTFEQLKASILKRKETASKPLKLERQFSTDPAKRISKDSANVRDVEHWAEAQGIKTP